MKTMSGNMLLSLAAAISAAVVFASAYLYIADAERSWRYVLAIAVVCIAWIARQLVRGDAADPASGAAKKRKVTQAIGLAGLLLGMPLMARLGWTGGFGFEFDARSNGFLMGALVVVFANTIPKQISSARGRALRRIAGWALVVGGAGYALAWLLLPLAYANDTALLILLFAFTYAVVHISWCIFRQRPAPPGLSG